jgi:hypothetical protein
MKKRTKAKAKPAVDLLNLSLVTVRLLDGLCDEVWGGLPSHSWRDLKTVREDIKRLRAELEALAKES